MVVANFGSSIVLGGDGNDTVMAGSNAVVRGGAGQDTINAWGGSSTVYGGAGDDTIMSANGTNLVVPGPGRDTVYGGTGDDTVALYHECELDAPKILDGGGGQNTLLTPVPIEQLTSRGFTISNFQTVTVADRPCDSECAPESACSGSSGGGTPDCHSFIRRLPNGDLSFQTRFPRGQTFVELFVEVDGIQTIAEDIVGSATVHVNGSVTYSQVVPADEYVDGDAIRVRFHAFELAGPALYRPGPDGGTWSESFTYPGPTDCRPFGDTDGDGVGGTGDKCPLDPDKTEPGVCDCGTPETDTDGDRIPDCIDSNPTKPGGASVCDSEPIGTVCADGICPGAHQCLAGGRCGDPNECAPPQIPGGTWVPVRLPGAPVYWILVGAEVSASQIASYLAGTDFSLAIVRDQRQNAIFQSQIEGPVYIGAPGPYSNWENSVPPDPIVHVVMQPNGTFVSVDGSQSYGVIVQSAPRSVASDYPYPEWSCEKFYPGVICTPQDGFEDESCTDPASLFGENVSRDQYIAEYEACLDGCAEDGVGCAENCAEYLLPPSQDEPSCLGPFAQEQSSYCEVMAEPVGPPCSTNAECPSGQVCGFVHCTADADGAPLSEIVDCEEAERTKRCGIPSEFPGSECAIGPDNDGLRCGEVRVCPAPGEPTPDRRGESLPPELTTETVFDEEAGKAALVPNGVPEVVTEPYGQESVDPDPSASGAEHSWCSYKLGEAQKSNTDTAAKKGGAGEGAIVQFDIDPNLELTYDLDPLPLGQFKFKAVAGASLTATTTFNFLNIKKSIEVVSAQLKLKAERCRVYTENHLMVFGTDFLPSEFEFDSAAPADEDDRLAALHFDPTACQAALQGYQEVADRALKAMRDAQELIAQYNRALDLGRTFDRDEFCEAVLEHVPEDFPVLPRLANLAGVVDGNSPVDCSRLTVEDIINAFILYYRQQIDSFLPNPSAIWSRAGSFGDKVRDPENRRAVDPRLPNGSFAESPSDAESRAERPLPDLRSAARALSEFGLKQELELKLPSFHHDIVQRLVRVNFAIGPVPVSVQLDGSLTYGLKADALAGLDLGALLNLQSCPTTGDCRGQEIAYAGASGEPYASAGVTLFAGSDVSTPGFRASVGVEGAVKLGTIRLPAFARASIKAKAFDDLRPLSPTLKRHSKGSIDIGNRRFEFDLGYRYGARLKLGEVLKGKLSAKARVRFLWYKRTWRRTLVNFGGLGINLDEPIVSGGGEWEGLGITVPWARFQPPTPFLDLLPLEYFPDELRGLSLSELFERGWSSEGTTVGELLAAGLTLEEIGVMPVDLETLAELIEALSLTVEDLTSFGVTIPELVFADLAEIGLSLSDLTMIPITDADLLALGRDPAHLNPADPQHPVVADLARHPIQLDLEDLTNFPLQLHDLALLQDAGQLDQTALNELGVTMPPQLNLASVLAAADSTATEEIGDLQVDSAALEQIDPPASVINNLNSVNRPENPERRITVFGAEASATALGMTPSELRVALEPLVDITGVGSSTIANQLVFAPGNPPQADDVCAPPSLCLDLRLVEPGECLDMLSEVGIGDPAPPVEHPGESCDGYAVPFGGRAFVLVRVLLADHLSCVTDCSGNQACIEDCGTPAERLVKVASHHLGHAVGLCDSAEESPYLQGNMNFAYSANYKDHRCVGVMPPYNRELVGSTRNPASGSSIRCVQSRLRALGYRTAPSGSLLAVTGTVTEPTRHAIRVFQSASRGFSQIAGVNAQGVDGISGGATYRWLAAGNSPAWIQRAQNGTGWSSVDNFENYQNNYSTNWTDEIVQLAALRNRGDGLQGHPVIRTNDFSVAWGGDHPDHSGHESGMDMDARLADNTSLWYDYAVASSNLERDAGIWTEAAPPLAPALDDYGAGYTVRGNSTRARALDLTIDALWARNGTGDGYDALVRSHSASGDFQEGLDQIVGRVATYDRDATVRQLESLMAEGSCFIYFNDPAVRQEVNASYPSGCDLDPSDPSRTRLNPNSVRFSSGHANHYHVHFPPQDQGGWGWNRFEYEQFLEWLNIPEDRPAPGTACVETPADAQQLRISAVIPVESATTEPDTGLDQPPATGLASGLALATSAETAGQPSSSLAAVEEEGDPLDDGFSSPLVRIDSNGIAIMPFDDSRVENLFYERQCGDCIPDYVSDNGFAIAPEGTPGRCYNDGDCCGFETGSRCVAQDLDYKVCAKTACDQDGPNCGCVPGQRKCGPAPERQLQVRICNESGQWEVQDDCAGRGALCKEGDEGPGCSTELPAGCTPNALACDGARIMICDEATRVFVPHTTCTGPGATCVYDDLARPICVERDCEPGEMRCSESGGEVLTCSIGGVFEVTEDCFGQGAECVDGEGLASCDFDTAPKLTDILFSEGTLSPVFDPDAESYTLTVPVGLVWLSVIPTGPVDTSITVNGTSVLSAESSPPIQLGIESQVVTLIIGDASGRSRIYEVFVERAPAELEDVYIKPSEASGAELGFGAGVGLDGDTLAVITFDGFLPIGDPDHVHFFGRSEGVWSEQGRLPVLPQPFGAQLITRLALDGDTLVVGRNSGGVQVFTRGGGVWVEQASLDRPDPGFGFDVALDGDTLAVGGAFNEPFNPTGAPTAVYVFSRSGNTWTEQQILRHGNPEPNRSFGTAVALSGDTLVIADPGDRSSGRGVDCGGLPADCEHNQDAPFSGAVHVFKRNAGTWSREAYIKASNTDGGSQFGSSIALVGDVLVVGASLEASAGLGVNCGDGSTSCQEDDSALNRGAAYIFTRTGSTWVQQAYVKPTTQGTFFGTSTAISEDTVLVGMHQAVTVLRRTGNAWAIDRILRASNADQFDTFGSEVTISNGTIVVGASHEDSAAIGIDCPAQPDCKLDNGASNRGAVYVFQ